MSRFPSIICLAGLAIFSVGVLMMLRFMVGPDAMTLTDPSRQRDAEALFAVAGRTLFSIYAFAIAVGAAMFCAGLAMLLGRLRSRWPRALLFGE